MNHFSNLFGKLKAALDGFEQDKKIVQGVILKHCGKAPESSEIETKDGVVHLINLQPAFKQTLFMRKQAILSDLQEKGLQIFDIR